MNIRHRKSFIPLSSRPDLNIFVKPKIDSSRKVPTHKPSSQEKQKVKA